jgi:hypothetical protein
MAAGVLPKPGTKFGPCKKACVHRDCILTRKMAEAKCPKCGQPIGYGVGFYETGEDGFEGMGSYTHAACAE